MITDTLSASACCTAALACLKDVKPSDITVTDSDGNEHCMKITYEYFDKTLLCICNEYCAYAETNPADFALHYSELCVQFVAEHSEFINMVFKSASKVMVSVTGADLYLFNTKEIQK